MNLSLKLNQNAMILIQGYALESVVCKMLAILSPPQCVDTSVVLISMITLYNGSYKLQCMLSNMTILFAEYLTTFSIHYSRILTY